MCGKVGGRPSEASGIVPPTTRAADDVADRLAAALVGHVRDL
jgi:hypothetical protein